MAPLSRRTFLAFAGALLLMGSRSGSAARAPRSAGAAGLRGGAVRPPVRTVTAGVSLRGLDDAEALGTALALARDARSALERRGHVVQTIRLSTQPLRDYAPSLDDGTIERIVALEALLVDAGALLSVGPVGTDGLEPERVAAWGADLVRATSVVSFSVPVAPGPGFAPAARAAAETILALSSAAPGGEANFRFAAACGIPPETPFYPVAWHAGEPAFAIGLESAGLVGRAFARADGREDAARRLREAMSAEIQDIEELAAELARESGWRFAGVDVSPAPSLEASIGGAIESLTGAPFGSASTLAACALVTGVLQDLPVRRCGYSGLMLPVLEDEVLARRASEGRFGVRDVLLYSSVCGTGLDVIPLPGDVSPEVLSALVGDVAALADRLRKPLAARLLPIPGAAVGDRVEFDNPHLTACAVLAPE